MAQSGRKNLLEFQQSTDRRLFYAGDTASRRGSQSESYGHRFIVIQKQRRQNRPSSELVASCTPEVECTG